MAPKRQRLPNPAEAKLLAGLHQDALLLRLGWKQWLQLQAPYAETGFTTREVTTRFNRNGYDWDIHGTLYLPDREVHPDTGFFLIHGGAVSEREFLETPDGRPGLACILASQGFRTLAVTYPGHYPPNGVWDKPVATRQPFYLLDRKLSRKEIFDRNRKATLNVYVEGAARLTDSVMAGRKIYAYGHSAGGNMAINLHRFLKKTEIIGMVGWGSGIHYAWLKEWSKWVGVYAPSTRPIDSIARRSPTFFTKSGYEDPPALTPWGGAQEFIAWGNDNRSHMRMGLLDNQRSCDVEVMKTYAKLTGLPELEYLDHLHDPWPQWLARTPVIVMTGENDLNHWGYTDKVREKLAVFTGEKFAQRTPRTRVILVPKYGHYGFLALHNEKVVYTWLWAIREGFFDVPGR